MMKLSCRDYCDWSRAMASGKRLVWMALSALGALFVCSLLFFVGLLTFSVSLVASLIVVAMCYGQQYAASKKMR